MRIPLNRVVAFAGPYISVIAGGIAAWLVARVNVPGVPGLDEANVATDVAGALTFLLVAVLSWVGQSRWLTGVHIELQQDARLARAALAGAASPPQPARPPADRETAMPPAVSVAPEAAEAPPSVAPAVAAAPPSEAPSAAAAPPSVAPAAAAAPPFDGAADDGALDPPTIVDEALPHDTPDVDAGSLEPGETETFDTGDLPDAAATTPDDPDDAPPPADTIPDGTPDALRPVMPSEVPLQGEPDEVDP